jgi:hypothetical protein
MIEHVHEKLYFIRCLANFVQACHCSSSFNSSLRNNLNNNKDGLTLLSFCD